MAAKKPLSAIDLSRYEAQDPPSASELAGLDPVEAKAQLETALSRAYASATYLSGRRAHLALLDNYGKNAWLIGNWQLEAELKALERELAEARKEIDVLAFHRRRTQDEVAGELKGLEETWKRGVGQVLETEIAVEGLRKEVLEELKSRA